MALGPLPQLYPFIVNDPGEGTQAKRRTGAVIIDHLTPPLTRAETYGPLKDLEALVGEIYLKEREDYIMYVKAHKDLEYVKVVDALDRISRSGVRVAALITDQTPNTESLVTSDRIMPGSN